MRHDTVGLPALLVFTDRTRCAGSLAATVAVAVECGARAVVLRERDLPEPDRARLVADLRAALEPVGGIVIVARSGRVAVHLSAFDPFPAARPGLVGRSCHDAAEVARAAAEGCDYVTVSPVFPTASKPGYGPALGLGGLAVLARAAPAAYALGGVRPADVAGCLAAGARGVAVMGPVMREPKIVGDYLAAFEEAAA